MVGEPVHWARGEWQCARVYAVLGRAEPALHHAGRCLELATQHDLGPFDLGAAYEAIARAYLIAGDCGARRLGMWPSPGPKRPKGADAEGTAPSWGRTSPAWLE